MSASDGLGEKLDVNSIFIWVAVHLPYTAMPEAHEGNAGLAPRQGLIEKEPGSKI